MTPAIATIGVYDFTQASFIDALREAGVVLVLDVRQRRGVRGAQYAWANVRRLEASLDAAAIGYRHVPELAPTTALREAQYREDARQGVGKRNRAVLAPVYRDGYRREILDPFDLDALLAGLPAVGPSALLCVERDPEACHRGLIADRLTAEHGIRVTHLRPAEAR
jgi:uncharacterized protein (DUF488 family)